ncbi:hypothetical protein K9L16_00800 [Candidatus Pacearchaeota archaeon]|nr:hypothetical protein [Candidatus Pacearchaeota archaeon]
MTFKINISTPKGKTYKLEAEAPGLLEKELGDKIKGEKISSELTGYEFEITGASDKSGFTSLKEVEGFGLKKVLLTYGKAMKRRPKKEGKKKRSDIKPKGLRLRKTVRGRVISEAITQINLKLLKEGNKKLSEIFPDQNKVAEPEETSKEQPEKPKETSQEKTPEEKPKEEVKEQKPSETK